MRKPVILLFEDEAEVNALLCQMLEEEGFVVQSALTCQEAIDLITNFRMIDPPSLALLDIKQSLQGGIPDGVDPDKVGFHLAQLIRYSRMPIPIIFLTAFQNEYERDAKKYEHYDFIKKGNSPKVFSDELKAKINKAISEQRVRDWSRLPLNKICIKENRIVKIYDMDDILFFEGDGGQVTKVHLQSSDKVHTLSLTPGFLFEQIDQILHTQMQPNPFVEVFKGKYARIDKIVAFSSDNLAYFDHDGVKSVKINNGTYTRLQEKYPPISMY